MRVQLLPIVALLGVTLIPLSGEASPITNDLAIPGLTAANDAAGSGNPEADSNWAGSALPSLFDSSGDSLLLLSSSNSSGSPGEHDKLRGLDFSSFVPDLGTGGGSCCGSGGGSGLPGLDTSSLFQSLNLDLNLDLDLDIDLPLDQCCSETCCGEGGAGQTVPEPSLLLLAGPALAMGVRRSRRLRASDQH